VNVIPLTGGSMRSWRPGDGRIGLSGTDRFGGAAGGEVQQ
jgi:Glycosyl hydrolase family 1